MKKGFLLLSAALFLLFLSGSIYTWGIEHDLRGLSPAERMSTLDTTIIGEKWIVIKLSISGFALLLLMVAAFFFYRDRDKILKR